MHRPTPITRALISVFDKTGLDTIAAFLKQHNILIISTGGTKHYLETRGFSVTDISAVGQFPEILDGRVKTLTPRIHAGILADRAQPEHMATLREHDIAPIDLVITNLYPFSKVAQQENVDFATLIENIDIGGPTMLRAAAKNHAHVVVLSSPEHYSDFISHYQEHQGTTLAFRKQRALDVFRLTQAYDGCITTTLKEFIAPDTPTVPNYTFKKALRYGENPHQKGLLFEETLNKSLSIAHTDSEVGKELSYNNLLDAHAALWCLRCLMHQQESSYTGAIVIKHGIPCGAALHQTQSLAVEMAIKSDEKSAFGGIIALSHPCDKDSAELLHSGFFEVVIAPSFTDDALTILHKKPHLRLLAINELLTLPLPRYSMRSIFGGMLMQDHETEALNKDKWTVVTDKKPDPAELKALEFAFRLVKPTPSNAITLASPTQLLGVGAGQPNRVQSVMLAIEGARERGFSLDHAALASDAFFPFSDSLELAHKHGIRLIIQPGGSIRDKEVIATANELGMCMVMTYQRHFKH